MKIKTKIKNMPNDIKQIVLSLSVSVMLITGSLMMLYSYMDSISETITKDVQVVASQTEETKTP